MDFDGVFYTERKDLKKAIEVRFIEIGHH